MIVPGGLHLRTLLLAASAWPVLGLASCATGSGAQPVAVSPGTAPQQDSAVATYRGGTVTLDEYRLMLRATGLSDEPERRLDRARSVAVTEVLAVLALQGGADQLPSTRVAVRLLDERVLGAALRLYLMDRIVVTDEEIATAAAALADQLDQPRRVRLRNLFKQFPIEHDPAAVARVWSEMERIRRQLADGADFSELAARESDSQTRYRGGRLGLIDPELLDPAVASVVAELGPGETSPIIETPLGLTILRCDEVVEASTPDSSMLLGRAEEAAATARLGEEWQRLGDELMRDVRIDLEAVRHGGGSQPAIVLSGGGSISVEETRELLRLRKFTESPATRDAAKTEEVLRSFALGQQLAAHARQLGLDSSPDTAAELSWGRLRVLADEELQSRVARLFQPTTTAEAEAFFVEHRDGFQAPEEFHVGAIVLGVPTERLQQTYAEAEALRAEIEGERTSFAEAARRFSSHPSAGHGGDLGWLDRWQLSVLGPVVAETVPNLEPGQVSRVVLQKSSGPAGAALWIVRLEEVRPARPMSFERAVAEGLIAELDRQRWDTLRDQVLQELESELDVRLAHRPAQ